MAIKVVVDSASDIDEEDAERLGIEMVPMEINFGEERYYDGVTLGHREFFEKLIETDVFPKTSQINEYRFSEVFARSVEAGEEVLCITLSKKLSGTYHSAESAAKKYNGKVRTVNSNNVCIGERLLVQYALRLIEEGRRLDEIERELNEKKRNIRLLALLNTLKYLKKGGRISPLVAFAGERLNLKPVIAIEGGEVKLVGKALGSKKGNNLLMQLVRENGGIDFSMPYATAYSGLDESLLQKYLEDSGHLWRDSVQSVPVYQIGSTIGAHAGPGAIAVAFFGKN